VKALIDQNLSFRLLDALSSRFPGSCHVRDVGLTGDDDERIWRLAKDERLRSHLPPHAAKFFKAVGHACGE